MAITAARKVMAWCEANAIDYILGLSGNAVLDRLVEPIADDVRVRRAQAQAPVVRRYGNRRLDPAPTRVRGERGHTAWGRALAGPGRVGVARHSPLP